MNSIIQQIRNAALYSWHGMQSTYKGELAFRIECVVGAGMLIIALCLPVTIEMKAALIATALLVLAMELLNTAIECSIDLISPDVHPLAKRAKDAGSAAVFVALLMTGVVWVVCLFTFI